MRAPPARTRRALAALLTAATALAIVPAIGSAGRLRTVTIGSNFFDPPKITIHRGDRVRWNWEPGFSPHNVTVRSGPERFHSRTQSAGSYTRTFRKPGTFRLRCTIHPMGMTLVVRR